MKKRKWGTRVSLFLIFTLIAAGLFFYNNYIRGKLSEQSCETLQGIMEQQRFNFYSKLEDEMEEMRSFASIFNGLSSDEDDIIKTLSYIEKESGFEFLAFARPDGKSIDSDGNERNLSDRDYFRRALSGETVVSDPLRSKVRDIDIIAVATPVMNGGEIIGVLVGTYDIQKLNYLFLTSFGGDGYAFVTTDDGSLVAMATNDYTLFDSDNIFEFWREKVHFYMHEDLETIKSNLANNISGHARFQVGSERRYVHYAPIGINGWCIFSLAPEQAVEKTSNRILEVSMMLTISVALIFGAFSLFNFYQQKKHVAALVKIAYEDDLTGAPTLAKFKMDAQRVISDNPGKSFLLVKFDVEKFKLINKIYGHATGDHLLRMITQGIKSVIRTTNDLYARLNIDEFVILHEILPTGEFSKNRQGFREKVAELMGDDFHFDLRIPAGHYHINVAASRILP